MKELDYVEKMFRTIGVNEVNVISYHNHRYESDTIKIIFPTEYLPKLIEIFEKSKNILKCEEATK